MRHVQFARISGETCGLKRICRKLTQGSGGRVRARVKKENLCFEKVKIYVCRHDVPFAGGHKSQLSKICVKKRSFVFGQQTFMFVVVVLDLWTVKKKIARLVRKEDDFVFRDKELTHFRATGYVCEEDFEFLTVINLFLCSLHLICG